MKDQNRTKKQLTDELQELRHKISELQVKVKQHECTEGTLEEYQKVIENSRAMIAVVNQHYRYVLANPGFIEYHGLDREHVIGRSVLDVLGKDVFEEVVKKHLDNCFQGKIVQYQMRYGYPKLGERDLLVQYFPVENPGGINRVVSIIQDITESKQMEEALRESEQRFRSLVETTSDWVWEVNEHGVYTYASPKVKELLGYDPEEVIGREPFDFMARDEAERTRKLFRDIMESRKSFPRLENTNLHKDGHLVVLETSGVPIFESDGHFKGYRGIDRDITERKRVEDERETLIRTLEDSLAKIRRLQGLLPICASCKKIRNDKGYWEQLEAYIEEHSEAEFSHGLCPDCMKKLYGFSLGEDGKIKEE